MGSRILTISIRISRGLLAAVFVMGNLFHGNPCCCASLSCGESQGEDRCCTVDATQGCCCCQQSSDDERTGLTCCCSRTSQPSSAGCQGQCHCFEPPLSDGIITPPQRIQQKQVPTIWLTDFDGLVGNFTSITNVELRPEQQFQRDPCAHNLRQAILCVWRN